MSLVIIKIIFILQFGFQFFLRRFYQKKYKNTPTQKNRTSRKEKAIIMLKFIGLGGVPLYYCVLQGFPFADFSSATLLPFFSLPFFILGGIIWYQSHEALGSNFSIGLEIKEEHELITSGIYRKIQHPMYLAAFLFAFGQALLLPNYIAAFSGILAVSFFYFSRLKAEESLLKEHFQSDYLSYHKKTKRLLPF